MDVDTTDLDAQIAALQATKARKLAAAERVQRDMEKEQVKVLIEQTPTKTKPRARDADIKLPIKPAQPKFTTTSVVNRNRQDLPSVPKPIASTMSTSLAVLRSSISLSNKSLPPFPRSSSFTDRMLPNPTAGPSRRSTSPELAVDPPGPQRDTDDLTISENLLPGPKEFGRDPEGEEEWIHLEPNSGIRLSKRTLSHAAVQDHLSGRYFLPPSLLYSVIRLTRDGATYDVPVEGDWVTIAVVAERGEIRVSGSKQGGISDDDDGDETLDGSVKQGGKPLDKATKDKERWKKRRGPKKYLNLKLCSLPPRASSLGGKGKGPSGDALLQLLLFEADAVIRGEDESRDTKQTSYRGGSGGAYEKWCNLSVGSVIAILNPRVLRPLRSGPQAPHPLTLPLALNPTSADGVTLLGQSRDLGCCNATQKDGNRCKTWVDLRQSAVCEYHVHAAVQRGRAGRAEFTASTSSFALSTRPTSSTSSSREAGGGGGGAKRKYDPSKRQGLLPATGPQSAPPGQDNGGGGVTYVIGGNAVHTRTDGGLRQFGDEHLAERLGRSRAGKRQRKMEEQEAEKALSRLLEKDGGGASTGGKYLAILGKSMGDKGDKGRMAKQDKKGKEGNKGNGGLGERVDVEVDKKRPFSVGAIRKIGFDPTARKGDRDDDTTKKLEAIASLKESSNRPLNLSRPKGLSRSNVRAPPSQPMPSSTGDIVQQKVDSGDVAMIDLD